MNTHLLALQLMAVQGCLGAFDTIYHHELTEALPQHSTAQRELSIHASRALIYSALFFGLSSWVWNGLWALVLFGIFGIEIILTLWDFVVEDQTRLLPATERITHTVLAINGGAFIVLLALNVPNWLAEPTALQWQPHGLLGAFLALCGAGVGISGLRDALAARDIGTQEKRRKASHKLQFGDTTEHALVTGATGFIGQLLVRALLADGHEVTVLTRKPRQAAWMFSGKVRCISSMSDLPSTQQFDVIVNLAGARILGWRWTAVRRTMLHRSRVALTHDLVTWIARAHRKPRLLLSASAIGYYGIQAQGDNTALTEDHAHQSIFMSQLCKDWEAAAHAAGTYGVRVICMRFGVVFGRQGALPMMLLPIKLGLGGRLGTGQQWLSWIHVQDVLHGIAHLWVRASKLHTNSEGKPATETHMAADVSGAYNFTAPGSVSQRQFSEIAAKVMRRPCFIPTPAFPIRLALGEQADLLLEGQRVTPARLQTSGYVFNYPNLQCALQDLC